MRFVRKAKKGQRIILTGQLALVRRAMSNGGWMTLAQINKAVHGREAGTSARLRDLRKEQFGGYLINRKNENGRFYYRMERAG